MRVYFLMALFSFTNLVLAQVPSPRLRTLMDRGGIATFDLTVRDDRGNLVEGVDGVSAYWCPSEKSSDRSLSDEKGHLLLSGRAYVDGHYILDKDGYYRTYERAKFEAPEEEERSFFSRRRWKPVVRDVELKKIRNPISVCEYRPVELWIPSFVEPLGLDLSTMEWTAPYGRGKNVDMVLSMTSEKQRYGSKIYDTATSVTLMFPNPMDGIQLFDADLFSQFVSSYTVRTDIPFASKMTFPFLERSSMLPRSKYLVFRVRSRVSSTGELLSANYGKILGRIQVTETMIYMVAVFFNPTPNDINLEFDSNRNLVSRERLKELQQNRLCKPVDE